MRKVKGYLSSIMIVLLFANTTNAAKILEDHPSFNYDHCEGEAEAVEGIAKEVFGLSDADAYEAGNDAFMDCVAEVDAYAKAYWATH